MLSYLRQISICESVLEMIRQTLARSDEADVKRQANYLPSYDSVLRAASLSPSTDTEERLQTFIIDHVLKNLRLTVTQKEHLSVTPLTSDRPASDA
jgi:hypothetical protein